LFAKFQKEKQILSIEKTLGDLKIHNSTFSLTVSLKPIVMTVNRQVYTILDMIGKVGGLNDGLIYLTGWLVAFYNSRVFNNEIATAIFSPRTAVKQRKTSETIR